MMHGEFWSPFLNNNTQVDYKTVCCLFILVVLCFVMRDFYLMF